MKKNKNTVLLIILLALVATFAVTKVFRAPALKSNLDTDLFAIDTSLIRSLSLSRPGKTNLTLEKTRNIWTVSEADKKANAGVDAVNDLLETLSQVKPERIISKSQEKWATYQVDDSASIHMQAFDVDNEPVIDWYIGKESQGLTYVRPADEDEVYAMEGGLRNRMNKDFNDWRDKTFLRMKPASVIGITYKYPSDSGFVLLKNNSKWMIDNQVADSAQVERYLLKFQSRNLRDFESGFASSRAPDITLSIDTAGERPAVIKAWKDGDAWILNSTFQPDAYFRDSRVDDDLFVGKNSLLTKK